MEKNNTEEREDDSSSKDESIEVSILRQNEVLGKYRSIMRRLHDSQLKEKIWPKDHELTKMGRRLMFTIALSTAAEQFSAQLDVVDYKELIKQEVTTQLEYMISGYKELLDAREATQDEQTGDLINITKELKPKLLEKAVQRYEKESVEFLSFEFPEDRSLISELVERWKQEIDVLESIMKILLDDKTKDTVNMNHNLMVLEEKKSASAQQTHLQNAIYIAILHNDPKQVRILLKDAQYKSKINEVRDFQGFGKTPLHLACELGCLDIIKILRENNLTDPKILGTDGYSTLHFAARRANANTSKIIEYCVKEMKLDLEAKTAKQARSRTPMLTACHEGNLEAMKALRSLGASLLSTEYETGHTALHIACERGHYAIVEWLCGQGLSPFASNANGESPVYLAVFCRCIKIAKYFYDRGLWLSKSERQKLKDANFPLWATAEIAFPE